MGRMVDIYEGIGCKELEGNVLREFKLDEGRYRVSLRYWPPTSFELATGIRTPPVLITNHGAVNLNWKTDSVDIEVVDASGMAFVSPEAARFVEKRDFRSASSKKGYFSSAASKTRSRVIDISDEDELVREVEKLEETIMSEGVKGGSGKGEDESGFNLATDKEDNFEVDEISVRLRGYDKEFWSPLLAGDYGGSAAVNVVYNEEEIVEDLTKKK
ncbi:unnamed protein product, partial [Brassica rapa subsp. narinosa]